jgi:hypothetical protein
VHDILCTYTRTDRDIVQEIVSILTIVLVTPVPSSANSYDFPPFF